MEEREDNTPPFYISLNIHNKVLHNCLLDYSASHKLMPKVVMGELGLDITRKYHYLFSFDSKKVHYLGVTKDLAVTLQQIPIKSILMDIVVADIPLKFGMLLSRAWAYKLGGNLQMDLSYAIVPIFNGETKRLYRETKYAFNVSNANAARNHPIYGVEQDLGCYMLEEVADDKGKQVQVEESQSKKPTSEEGIWKLYFNSACSREGSGAGVLLISPSGKKSSFSYKLTFENINNTDEYEALLLGLEEAKSMKISSLEVFGDSELVIKKVTG